MPGRRPRRAISAERALAPTAAPRTTAAPGTPLSAGDRSSSLATIGATVTAAMCPVEPSATPATRTLTVRLRSRTRCPRDVGRSKDAIGRVAFAHPGRRSGGTTLASVAPIAGELVGVERGDEVVGDAPDVDGHRGHEPVAPGVGQAGVGPRRSVSQAVRSTKPALSSRSTAGRAAPREQDAVGEVAHPERAAGEVELGEDVEVGRARPCSASSSASSARMIVAWAVRNVRQASMPGLSAASDAVVTVPRHGSVPRCGCNEDSNPATVASEPQRQGLAVLGSVTGATTTARSSRRCSSAGDLDVPTERVDESHLLGCPAGYSQQLRGRDEDRQALALEIATLNRLPEYRNSRSRGASSGDEVAIE